MTTTCRRTAILACLLGVLVGGSASAAEPDETNPLFTETKAKNYLPHMTWKQAEEALQTTDMVIIPVGSIEQHGTHLPLCSDIYYAIEVAKLIAQETDVLVAPAVFAGLSEHHMGFPGTVSLSPETFEAVVFETAQSLIAHGIRKVMIYNGHGGNTASVTRVIHKINQTTLATAVNLGGVRPPDDESEEEIPFDWHAGENETSSMLYLAPGLAGADLSADRAAGAAERREEPGRCHDGEHLLAEEGGKGRQHAGHVRHRGRDLGGSSEGERGARPAQDRAVHRGGGEVHRGVEEGRGPVARLGGRTKATGQLRRRRPASPPSACSCSGSRSRWSRGLGWAPRRWCHRRPSPGA